MLPPKFEYKYIAIISVLLRFDLSSNNSLLISLDTVISLIEQIKQNRRMDQASYNTLLVLYITLMVLGGVGNMAIIIACFKNKVGYGKPLQKSVWLFLK